MLIISKTRDVVKSVSIMDMMANWRKNISISAIRKQRRIRWKFRNYIPEFKRSIQIFCRLRLRIKIILEKLIPVKLDVICVISSIVFSLSQNMPFLKASSLNLSFHHTAKYFFSWLIAFSMCCISGLKFSSASDH